MSGNTVPPDWLQTYNGVDPTGGAGNFSSGLAEKPKPKRRKRAKAKQKTLEQQYAQLISAGVVRIERRRGRAPRVIWL